MKRINNVTLTGYVHYKKEAKTQKGETKLSFSLNVFRSKPEGGNAVYDYIQCVSYRETADKLNLLEDGAEAMIIGEWRHETYNDRDGNKKSIDFVKVDDGFSEIKLAKVEEPKVEEISDEWLPF
jgi:single-stranded DNA-binding protein